MSSKLPKSTLSLKQPPREYRRRKENGRVSINYFTFLLRQEVLKLYRDIFKSLRLVQDENTRNELKEWARTDFKNNKHHTDELTIKSLLHHGKKSLKDLQTTAALSKS